MATCYRHPDRETGVSCSSCGRAICPDCMTPTPVGMRCPECSRERTQVRTIQSVGDDPTATYVLIALNVMAFVGQLAGGGSVAEAQGSTVANGGLYGPEVVAGDYWRLITYSFLHSGPLHLGFNMYLLYILGTMLEPSVGRVRFVALYFTAVLGGALGALLLEPNSFTVGASGGVFGLMGGAVVIMRARGFDPMASGIPALIGLNLLITFVFPGISIGGHIGGLVAGVVAAYVLVEVGDRVRSALAPIAICTALAAGLAVAAVMVA